MRGLVRPPGVVDDAMLECDAAGFELIAELEVVKRAGARDLRKLIALQALEPDVALGKVVRNEADSRAA